MDPDVNLAETLHSANAIVRSGAESAEAVELAERVLALNEWLSSGGFLPVMWSRASRVQSPIRIVQEAFSDVNEMAMLGVWSNQPQWAKLETVGEIRGYMIEQLLAKIIAEGLTIGVASEYAPATVQEVWDAMRTDYGDEWHINHQDTAAVRLVEELGIR